MKPVVIALLATLAVLGGIVVTAIAALTTVVYFVSRRLLGHRRSAPSVPPRRPVAPRNSPVDAIDVTATEVKSEPHALQSGP